MIELLNDFTSALDQAHDFALFIKYVFSHLPLMNFIWIGIAFFVFVGVIRLILN